MSEEKRQFWRGSYTLNGFQSEDHLRFGSGVHKESYSNPITAIKAFWPERASLKR